MVHRLACRNYLKALTRCRVPLLRRLHSPSPDPFSLTQSEHSRSLLEPAEGLLLVAGTVLRLGQTIDPQNSVLGP